MTLLESNLEAPRTGYIAGTIMTGLDSLIDEKVKKEILSNPKAVAEFPAWNFHALVWATGEVFHCAASRFGSHVVTFSDLSLDSIREAAFARFGVDPPSIIEFFHSGLANDPRKFLTGVNRLLHEQAETEKVK